MTTVDITSLKHEIRRRIRAKRQSLTSLQIQQYDEDLYHQFIQIPELTAQSKIAIYLSQDNEIGTQNLIDYFFNNKVHLYLPKLYEDGRHQLHFVRYLQTSKMKLNRYKIPEPVVSFEDYIEPENLDLILLPLTAFDMQGNRLGMGGGYYDRTIGQSNVQTLKIGLAYDFQQVEECPIEDYDQPLDMIITPTRALDFRGNR